MCFRDSGETSEAPVRIRRRQPTNVGGWSSSPRSSYPGPISEPGDSNSRRNTSGKSRSRVVSSYDRNRGGRAPDEPLQDLLLPTKTKKDGTSKKAKNLQGSVAEKRPSEFEDIVFNIELDLEEDVVAELEQFVLFARLGLDDKCHTMFKETLEPYTWCFPVFAEYAEFLVRTMNREALRQLLKNPGTKAFAADELELLMVLEPLSRLSDDTDKNQQLVKRFDEKYLPDCPRLQAMLNAERDKHKSSMEYFSGSYKVDDQRKKQPEELSKPGSVNLDTGKSAQEQAFETYCALKASVRSVKHVWKPLMSYHQESLREGNLWQAQSSFVTLVKNMRPLPSLDPMWSEFGSTCNRQTPNDSAEVDLSFVTALNAYCEYRIWEVYKSMHEMDDTQRYHERPTIVGQLTSLCAALLDGGNRLKRQLDEVGEAQGGLFEAWRKNSLGLCKCVRTSIEAPETQDWEFLDTAEWSAGSEMFNHTMDHESCVAHLIDAQNLLSRIRIVRASHIY
ncbi:uncharacterized protein HMPREF1541_09291 [Cyphellophora europaea CBS 101466]|uniref:Uncharacterized protein n=1 Tax=Cyphellophora europaea (strain CBS 101466) TaxID=1220924 RepID=W2SC19_CYPE1|nr:uncharacterized protein HMPREF1541_09291 [Cyphellophora europaea CBS 101466]ETN45459.1 hypothetical protein HMPREF1541_09291 [Cyphellophora europaea CBS 101466]